MKPKDFYQVADELDKYRLLKEIIDEATEKLLKLISDSKYADYFFKDLENESWIVPLNSAEYFSSIPGPVEDPNNPGYFGMPFWSAGEYLKIFASSNQIIARDVAMKLDTENTRAIRTMLEALLKISPSLVAETIPAMQRWVQSPFTSFMMLSHELGIIMRYLAKPGVIDASLEVLRILTEPVGVKARYEEGVIEADTRFDKYWLAQSFTEYYPAVLEIDPLGAARIIEEQLIKSLEMEISPYVTKEDYPNYSYWRLNIRSDISNQSSKNFKNLLVDALIQALNKACEGQQMDVKETLERFLENKYAIFRRISVYLLRLWGAKYLDLVEKAYRINREKSSLSYR